jgi:hypothetical protein
MTNTPIVDTTVDKKLGKDEDIISEAPQRFADIVASDDEVEEDYHLHLISMLKEKKSEHLSASIRRNSDLLTLHSADEIRRNAKVTDTDQLLRHSFWEEVKNAESKKRKLKESNVWQGICTTRYWEKVVRHDEWKMAYVLTPVRDRFLVQKAAHSQGLENLLRIVNADPFKRKQGGSKELDPRIAKVVLEAFKILDDRVYGQAVQRVQTTTENNTKQLTPDELKKQISEMKDEGVDQPITIDVTPNK